MKKAFGPVAIILLLSTLMLVAYDRPADTPFKFPYSKGGLTNRQAAAHLLSRFTFGARPGDIDQVLAIGLEKWFDQQLNASVPDDSLNYRLASYDAIKLTNEQAVEMFPRAGQTLRMAVKDGIIDKDSVKADQKQYREKLAAYMQQKGLKPQQELFRQLINQKILRATYTNNQLQEVLTDFWFNHFNVSIVKNDCAAFIPAYERDVIRPNVLGKFNTLLLATAKSPAMLLYLDNFSSAAADESANDPKAKRRLAYAANQMQNSGGTDSGASQMLKKIVNQKIMRAR
jgi:uncharacterized protein (DUF1800 family)